jgi:hypothetical protein
MLPNALPALPIALPAELATLDSPSCAFETVCCVFSLAALAVSAVVEALRRNTNCACRRATARESEADIAHCFGEMEGEMDGRLWSVQWLGKT